MSCGSSSGGYGSTLAQRCSKGFDAQQLAQAGDPGIVSATYESIPWNMKHCICIVVSL